MPTICCTYLSNIFKIRSSFQRKSRDGINGFPSWTWTWKRSSRSRSTSWIYSNSWNLTTRRVRCRLFWRESLNPKQLPRVLLLKGRKRIGTRKTAGTDDQVSPVCFLCSPPLTPHPLTPYPSKPVQWTIFITFRAPGWPLPDPYMTDAGRNRCTNPTFMHQCDILALRIVIQLV